MVCNKTFSINVHPYIIPIVHGVVFSVAASPNYEGRITSGISIYAETTFLLYPLSVPINVEFGSFIYILDDFKGLFLSGGVEWIPYLSFPQFTPFYFRFPIDVGYKFLFPSGFTLRPFVGLSLHLVIGEFVDWSIPPDSFGLYLGYSW